MVHKIFLIMNWMGSEWILILLFMLSIVTVWVILQRYFELRKLLSASSRFWIERGNQWLAAADPQSWRGGLDDLRASYPCIEIETLDLIERAQSREGMDISNAVSSYLGQRKLHLEKLVGVLGTIGANAPFIGLLGTVLGIIRAFTQMSVTGLSGGIQNISGGIAEALVATAIGLFVAVPAVVFFNLLNKKIAVLIERSENLSELILSTHESK